MTEGDAMPERGGVAATFARWRVPLGFGCAAAALWLARPTPMSLVLGGAVAAIGESLRIWAAGHLRKSQEVTASGPYRWFAHPLYVGSSVLGGGFAIGSNRLAVAALIAGYLGVTLTAAARTEEARLRERFGERYVRYRRAAAGDEPADRRRRFSASQALANREHRAVAGVVLVWLFLLTKATYNGAFR